MSGTYRCPYPGCDWQPSRPVDSDNGLTQAVVHREVETHRESHADSNPEVRTDGGTAGEQSVSDAIYAALDEYADDTGKAPAGAVVTAVLDDTDYGLGSVCEVLRELAHTGQLYQPDATTIRRTNRDDGEDGDRDGE